MNAFEKLFIARTLLSLNQREAAEQAGIHPASLSILERGEKKFIPTEYLHFLHSKGIDINWIFSDSTNTNTIFRMSPEQDAATAHRKSYEQDSIQSILTGNDKAATKVIIHKHNTVSDDNLKAILEELKKLNTHLSLVQSSIPHVYGN